MIPLTVTSMGRKRYAISRPGRMDIVIIRATSPEEAGHAAAEEWSLAPNSYTIIPNPADPANAQEPQL